MRATVDRMGIDSRETDGIEMDETAAMTPLRRELRRRGWSKSRLQQELAALMLPSDKRYPYPISVKQIGVWERGQATPEDYWIEKLCAVFDMTAEDLDLFRAPVQPQKRMQTRAKSSGSTSSQQPDRRANRQMYLVWRTVEVERFDALTSGQTPHRVLNIYGPGGIGKTQVGRLLVKRAAAQAIPCGTLDCADLTLTPSQILHGLQRSLLDGPHAHEMESLLQPFINHFRDFQAITAVLMATGGVNTVFDTLGSIKEPARLSAAIDDVHDQLSPDAQRTLQNRFELERYLRGAERALTAAFVQGLQTVTDQLHLPLTLIIDTYENLETSRVESWICRDLAPVLPDGTFMIILGRNALTQIDFDWYEHDDTLALHALPELGETEAKEYLRHYGLADSTMLDRVYSFTGGYPLLLMLIRHLSQQLGGWDHADLIENDANRDYVATQLLVRILREERVQEVRLALERGAVARWLDPGAIAALLEIPPEEGGAIYHKLRRHSFVESHPLGIRFHDKIRELLDHRLAFIDPVEHARLKARVEAYQRERSESFRAKVNMSNASNEANGAN